MTPSCPNWLRVVLLCLAIAVFLPQLRRIWTHKTSTGFSLLYILFNLISATERFSLAFFLTVNAGTEPDFFVHSPRSTGDWLNLVQLGVDWVLFLLLFILSLAYPAAHRSIPPRIIAAAFYAAFTLISIIPLFTDALFPSLFHDPDERSPGFGVGLFAGAHFFFINPLVTVLGICSIIPQAIQIRSLLSSPSPGLGVVSIRDFALQGVVFALLAGSWVFRVRIGSGADVKLPFRSVYWYVRVAWAAGGTGAFAIVQGVLAILGRIGRKLDCEGLGSGETEPLLGEQRGDDIHGVDGHG